MAAPAERDQRRPPDRRARRRAETIVEKPRPRLGDHERGRGRRAHHDRAGPGDEHPSPRCTILPGRHRGPRCALPPGAGGQPRRPARGHGRRPARPACVTLGAGCVGPVGRWPIRSWRSCCSGGRYRDFGPARMKPSPPRTRCRPAAGRAVRRGGGEGARFRRRVQTGVWLCCPPCTSVCSASIWPDGSRKATGKPAPTPACTPPSWTCSKPHTGQANPATRHGGHVAAGMAYMAYTQRCEPAPNVRSGTRWTTGAAPRGDGAKHHRDDTDAPEARRSLPRLGATGRQLRSEFRPGGIPCSGSKSTNTLEARTIQPFDNAQPRLGVRVDGS